MMQANRFSSGTIDRMAGACRMHQDVLVKIVVIAGLCGFIVYRVLVFDAFPGTWESTLRHFRYHAALSGAPVRPDASVRWFWAMRLMLWTIESLNLAAYVLSYWTRIRPVRRAYGVMETLFPLAVSAVPLVIVLFRARLFSAVTQTSAAFHLYLLILILMGLGSFITLWGVLHLRRSFSLRIEARELVRSGPYRWVRHPIYSGYFLTFAGSCLLHFNAAAVLLYVLFVFGQTARARLEEEKLSQSFPEYADYQARTGMFLPKWNASAPSP